MTLETALAENTKAALALTVALNTVADNQTRLLAGQAAAIDKIEAAKTPKTPAAAKEPKTPVTPAAPKEASKAAVVSDDDVKAAAVAWMGKVAAGSPERADATKFLSAMLEHFGVGGKLTGPDSKLDDDMRKQARFFIQRKAAGLPVDFSGDYDFNADPKQGGAAPAAEEEDPLG